MPSAWEFVISIVGMVIASVISSRIVERPRPWVNWVVGGLVGLTIFVLLAYRQDQAARDKTNVTKPVASENGQPLRTQPEVFFTDMAPYNATDRAEHSIVVTMGGVKYPKGARLYGGFAQCGLSITKEFSWNLERKYSHLIGKIGLDDSDNNSDTLVVFYGEDNLLRQITLKRAELYQDVDVEVKGVSRLKITVTGCSAVDFADMKLVP